MSINPATLAGYRLRYPGYMLVFRTADNTNTVYVPGNPQAFTATIDETDAAMLEAVRGGMKVLVVAWGLQPSAPHA